MKLPIVFMYSGQGSNYYQMGKELFDSNKIFSESMLKADRICQDLLGFSVVSHLYDNRNSKRKPFVNTLLSHPAIFMVEYAFTQVLLKNNIRPDFVIGTSVGEFAAAVTGGVLDFENALQAVIKQALLLEQKCQPGAMLAILYDSKLYHDQSYLYQNSELAGVNFSSHFVVTGKPEKLELIIKKLKEKRIGCQLLPVSQGFHSTIIDTAKSDFLETTQHIQLRNSNIPFISCAYAKLMTAFPANFLWEIIRLPIQFQNAFQLLENQQPALYLDLGASGTLATFIKYNLTPESQSKALPILTPYGQGIKNLEYVLTLLDSNNV